MTASSVTARLKGFLIDHFPSARNRPLSEDEQLLANGILDSLGVLDLVGYIEQEFDVTLADEDLLPEHFATLRHLTAFVEEKQGVSAR